MPTRATPSTKNSMPGQTLGGAHPAVGPCPRTVRPVLVKNNWYAKPRHKAPMNREPRIAASAYGFARSVGLSVYMAFGSLAATLAAKTQQTMSNGSFDWSLSDMFPSFLILTSSTKLCSSSRSEDDSQ